MTLGAIDKLQGTWTKAGTSAGYFMVKTFPWQKSVIFSFSYEKNFSNEKNSVWLTVFWCYSGLKWQKGYFISSKISINLNMTYDIDGPKFISDGVRFFSIIYKHKIFYIKWVLELIIFIAAYCVLSFSARIVMKIHASHNHVSIKANVMLPVARLFAFACLVIREMFVKIPLAHLRLVLVQGLSTYNNESSTQIIFMIISQV